MKHALNAFYWLVIVALLIAGLIGCGLFTKSKKKDYSRTRTETIDNTVTVTKTTDHEGMKEQTILELDIRVPKARPGDPVVPDSAITTITEAITAAISKATRLKAKVSSLKEGSRQAAENRQENRDYKTRSDSANKSSDLLKDSNTSMIANVPWYVWVLGVGGLLVILYLVLKRYGLL